MGLSIAMFFFVSFFVASGHFLHKSLIVAMMFTLGLALASGMAALKVSFRLVINNNGLYFRGRDNLKRTLPWKYVESIAISRARSRLYILAQLSDEQTDQETDLSFDLGRVSQATDVILIPAKEAFGSNRYFYRYFIEYYFSPHLEHQVHDTLNSLLSQYRYRFGSWLTYDPHNPEGKIIAHPRKRKPWSNSAASRWKRSDPAPDPRRFPVAIDRLPRSYIYLSKRILTNLYHELEAVRPKWKIETKLGAPFSTISIGKKEPSTENLIWLAKKVTEAVSDQTGDLLYPGKYVRATVPMTCAELQSSGYPKSTVAWMHSWFESAEGTVFLALCGSVHNYEGYSPGDISNFRGWFPSSPPGLHRLIRYSALDYNDDINVMDSSTAHLILKGALEISRRLPTEWVIMRQEVEVLLEVFASVEQSREGFRSAIVGTPIWVGTPIPQPLILPQNYINGH